MLENPKRAPWWLLISSPAILLALSCAAVDVAYAVDAAAPAAAVPEPTDYRMEDFRKPVPATLAGATVLANDAARTLWTGKTAVFIDVYPHAPKPANLPKETLWREPPHYSIEDAVWLPNVGYGVLSQATESYFKERLARITGGDKTKALVFFCLRDCWMSWNSAKRAMTYGYSSVNWYPDGTDGWQEIGGLVVETKPLP